MKIRAKRILPYIILPAGLLLFYLAYASPHGVENVYSNGIYIWVMGAISNITGLLNFSLTGFIIIAAVLLCFYLLIGWIIRMIRMKGRRKRFLLQSLSRVYIAAGIIYFLFIFLWGINYHRLPFADIAGLEVKPASVDELAQVCEYFIGRTNTLRSRVSEDSSGFMVIDGGYGSVLSRADLGYKKVSAAYSQLGGTYGKPKPFFPSVLMSYEGISGMFFPFTGEANVNIDIPMAMLPATACHEMAHQRGFAREDEANFISYLACTAHDDYDFKYSGSLLATINLMNALYDHDPARYRALAAKYSPGVKRDMRQNYEFWHRYDGPVQQISESINDAYLKANNQKDGIYSYGRMVDLLIAEYRAVQGRG